MKMTTSWAFASTAVVAILVAGCTTSTTDDSEGGVTTSGTAGTTGTAGSAGAAGSTTGGSSGAGGSSDTDAAAPMSACETCAYLKCNSMKEVDNCENDKGANGCALFVDDFYDCLKTADTQDKVAGCGTDFASMVSSMGMSQGYVNELSGCVTDTDPTKGCLSECGAVAGGADAGTK